jgi:hypothetical protein
MLSNHLKAMSLRSSATSSCLFIGSLNPGEPPIYVGIYVDDIIYISALVMQLKENLKNVCQK